MNVSGCTLATYTIGGQKYERVPFKAFDWDPTIRDCNDCNATVGLLHHPGCDLEECPKCHDQFFASECFWEVRGALSW